MLVVYLYLVLRARCFGEFANAAVLCSRNPSPPNPKSLPPGGFFSPAIPNEMLTFPRSDSLDECRLKPARLAKGSNHGPTIHSGRSRTKRTSSSWFATTWPRTATRSSWPRHRRGRPGTGQKQAAGPAGAGPDAPRPGRPGRLPHAQVHRGHGQNPRGHAHRPRRGGRRGYRPGAGADDYITKPFSPRALVAPVAVLRRQAAAPVAEAALKVHAVLAINPNRREVSGQGKAVELTCTEFDILHFSPAAGLGLHPLPDRRRRPRRERRRHRAGHRRAHRLARRQARRHRTLYRDRPRRGL